MRYFTGPMSVPKWGRTLAPNAELGMLLSPRGWRFPHCAFYACDNDVFAHSPIGGRPDPNFWAREGESNWRRMLDKIPAEHQPQWIVLPDVVGNWTATLERAWRYRAEVETRGLNCALALQDGCNWKEVKDFAPHTVFVGGTTRWKWGQAPTIAALFGATMNLHLGRVNGERAVRRARQLGFDSADGTGLCRFTDATLPGVLSGLRQDSAQQELF